MAGPCVPQNLPPDQDRGGQHAAPASSAPLPGSPLRKEAAAPTPCGGQGAISQFHTRFKGSFSIRPDWDRQLGIDCLGCKAPAFPANLGRRLRGCRLVMSRRAEAGVWRTQSCRARPRRQVGRRQTLTTRERAPRGVPPSPGHRGKSRSTPRLAGATKDQQSSAAGWTENPPSAPVSLLSSLQGPRAALKPTCT